MLRRTTISICIALAIFIQLLSIEPIFAEVESLSDPSALSVIFENIDYNKSKTIRIIIEGNQIEFDVEPRIVNGRTMVPMRSIFEAFGLFVQWDELSKTAYAIGTDTDISFTLGSGTAVVNDEMKVLDAPAISIDGSTMIPLRFLSENLGYHVVWIGRSNLILISKSDIVEWRFEGHEYAFPYYEYEVKYINGVKTAEKRYTGNQWIPTAQNEQINNPNVEFDLKYTLYQRTFTYFLTGTYAPIHNEPSTHAKIIAKPSKNEKLDYIGTVNNNGTWYHVAWYHNGKNYIGYVSADSVTKRIFRLERMLANVMKADSEWEKGSITYVDNYWNRKGYAPLYFGDTFDKYGNRRSQSAPGYYDLNDKSEFVYITDGSLIRTLSKQGDYTKSELIKNGNILYIPNKYIAVSNPASALRKAIVIDRKNQNEAIFEKTPDGWKIISYTLATTGADGEYQQPTPLGFFFGIEKREKFLYFEDGTTNIQGYAPYAIRFSASSYVHGVPVDWQYDALGNQVDPGMQEFSKSIGTVPLSHRCVRNYTSHAKFLYDWYTAGETIVIVIE